MRINGHRGCMGSLVLLELGAKWHVALLATVNYTNSCGKSKFQLNPSTSRAQGRCYLFHSSKSGQDHGMFKKKNSIIIEATVVALLS